ncbi:MAG: hypothetical protein WA945_10925, partial [Arcobacteraceae bacterium]
MNINNNALLNTLVKRLEPSIQAKIESLSDDGKIDLSTIIKGKSIQTLLGGLINDIISGTKMKSDVSNVLETNKNILTPKNIMGELKQIIDLVKLTVQPTVQVEKLVDTLKNSLLDIKTLDAKILKNSLINSGVFLESKISQQNNSTIQNLSLLSTQLKSQLTLMQNVVSDVKINLPDNTKSNITQNSQTQQSSVQKDVQTIVKTIEVLQTTPLNIDKSLSLLKNVTEQIDKLDQKL